MPNKPTLTLNEYQARAMLTGSSALQDRDALVYGAMGLSGEAGEVLEAIKHHVYQGHPLDVAHLREELGDALWYIAWLASKLKLDLSYIAYTNVEKLQRRYPNGYSHEASLNRTV